MPQMLLFFALNWLQPGTRRVRILAIACAMLFLAAAFFFPSAHASAGPTLDFNPVSQIQSIAGGWWFEAKLAAQRLFFGLIVIEIVVFGFQMALFRDNLGEFFGGIALKVITIGLFLWFINQADWIFPAVFNSLDTAGGNITGTSEGSDFAGIIAKVGGGLFLIYLGMGITKGVDNALLPVDGTIFEGNSPLMGEAMTISTAHQTDYGLIEILGFMVVMALAVVALQYIIIQAEAAMVMAGGVIFLGFSGTKFTLPFAQGYMSYAINVGAKLLALHLGLAVANGLATTLLAAMAVAAAAVSVGTVDPTGASGPVAALTLAYVAFETLIMASILWFIPNLAGSFLSGQSTMSGSQMMGNAMGAATGSQMLSAGAGSAMQSGDKAKGLSHTAGASGAQANATAGSSGAVMGHGGSQAMSTSGPAPTALGGSGTPSETASASGTPPMTPGTSTNLGNAYTAGLNSSSPASAAGGALSAGGSSAGSALRAGGGGSSVAAADGGALAGGALAGGALAGGDGGGSSSPVDTNGAGSMAGGSSGNGALAGNSLSAGSTPAMSGVRGGGGNGAAAVGGGAPVGGGSSGGSVSGAGSGGGGRAGMSSGASGASGGTTGGGGGGGGVGGASIGSSGAGSGGGYGANSGGGGPLSGPTAPTGPDGTISALSGTGGGHGGGGGGLTDDMVTDPNLSTSAFNAAANADVSQLTDKGISHMGHDQAQTVHDDAMKQMESAELDKKRNIAYALSGIAQAIPRDNAPPSAVQVRLGMPEKL